MASARAIGEEITVFSYDNHAKLSRQLGCEVADAATIFARDQLCENSWPHFSDHFRLEGIERGLGTWTDLDVIFVRPLPATDYVFGWQNDKRLGNSVLRLPRDSELLQSYLAFCRERPLRKYVMPWMPWYTKCGRIAKAALGAVSGARVPAAKYGPAAFTYFAERCGADRFAFQPEVLYPLAIEEKAIARAYEPGYLESLIRPETVCVHLWHSTFAGIHGLQYPKQGWLAERANALLSKPPAAVA
ncbi:MAG: hypothetical protein QM780_01160 [Hyphomicrobium sp.]|uniref:hypothetical protein n=1 Tax=Hyphomicrobium sp. TaxID=82 RepID=UPI0039E6F686